MVSHWSLSDSKSPQVSMTLLDILADLSNAVVWIVSTRPLVSKSFNPSTNPLVTVPSAPITIGITVTFMFHSFIQFPCKVFVLILVFVCFVFLFCFLFVFVCLFFSLLFCGQPGQKSPQSCKFSFSC